MDLGHLRSRRRQTVNHHRVATTVELFHALLDLNGLTFTLIRQAFTD